LIKDDEHKITPIYTNGSNGVRLKPANSSRRSDKFNNDKSLGKVEPNSGVNVPQGNYFERGDEAKYNFKKLEGSNGPTPRQNPEAKSLRISLPISSNEKKTPQDEAYCQNRSKLMKSSEQHKVDDKNNKEEEVLVDSEDDVGKQIINRKDSPEKPLFINNSDEDLEEEQKVSQQEEQEEEQKVKQQEDRMDVLEVNQTNRENSDAQPALNKLTTIKEDPRDIKDQSNNGISNIEVLGDNLESVAGHNNSVNSSMVHHYLDNYNIIKMLGKGDNILYQLEDKSDNSKACLRIVTKKNLVKDDKDDLTLKITSRVLVKGLNNPNLIKFKE
jgi:hypothetical protein